MHLSRLLACALLLALLALRPSDAKPGAPHKNQRAQAGEELADAQAGGGGHKRGGSPKGDRSRLLRDLRTDAKSRSAWARLLHDPANERKLKTLPPSNCFGHKLDRIGSWSRLGC